MSAVTLNNLFDTAFPSHTFCPIWLRILIFNSSCDAEWMVTEKVPLFGLGNNSIDIGSVLISLAPSAESHCAWVYTAMLLATLNVPHTLVME